MRTPFSTSAAIKARRTRSGAEPSIPSALLAAISVLGAERLMTARVKRRLELTGLSWAEISPVLTGVRRIDHWAAAFAEAANTHEKTADFRRAAALAYLGQLPLSPYHPGKATLREQFRRCHVEFRARLPDIRFERLTLLDRTIVAYRETPIGRRGEDLPTVLLLPPLASTKEELTLLADPLLAAGFSVIRMDLPGQGESAAPLRPDSEIRIAESLQEIFASIMSDLIVGGISLGAHFALRLAAFAPDRIRGVFGISPLAVRTPAQWAGLPEIIYQYLDLYFAVTDRAETSRIGGGLNLEPETAGLIACPVRLYHAANDRLAQFDAPAVYRSLLASAWLTEKVVPDRHGCLLHLTEIAGEIANWGKGLPITAANIQSENADVITPHVHPTRHPGRDRH